MCCDFYKIENRIESRKKIIRKKKTKISFKMGYELPMTTKQCAIILIVWCSISFNRGECKKYLPNDFMIWDNSIEIDIFLVSITNIVQSDVSSIDGVKTFASTTSSTSPENSNSFSILTKEFLNKPDGEIGKRNLAKASARNGNGSNNNKVTDSDESDERQAYYYDKPKVPFEFESTNIHTNTVPPKK